MSFILLDNVFIVTCCWILGLWKQIECFGTPVDDDVSFSVCFIFKHAMISVIAVTS